MLKRSSKVDSIKILSGQFASVIQLGDVSFVQGSSRSLAVQREAELFFGNEGNFAEYQVFTESIPLPPISEIISHQTYNPPSSIIKVNNIHVFGVSSSSVFQVGNSCGVQLEARVKHIRHLSSAGTENNEVNKNKGTGYNVDGSNNTSQISIP